MNDLLRMLPVFVLGGLLGLTLSGASTQRGVTPPPLTLAQVQNLASLTTLRVHVADVHLTEIHGHTGSLRAALLVRGDLLIAVDLAEARFEQLDDEAKRATIVLPAPRAQSPRLDHARTRIYAITTSGMWSLLPTDDHRARLVNRAMGEAQRLVEHAAQRDELIEQARRNTETVIDTYSRQIGWSVTIRWADRPEGQG